MIYLLHLLGNIFIIKNCDFDIRYYDKLPIYYNFTSDYLTTDNKLNNCKILPEQVWQLVLSSIWHLSYMDFVLTFNSPSRPKKKTKQQKLKLAKREKKFLIMLLFVSAKSKKKLHIISSSQLNLGHGKPGRIPILLLLVRYQCGIRTKICIWFIKCAKKFGNIPFIQSLFSSEGSLYSVLEAPFDTFVLVQFGLVCSGKILWLRTQLPWFSVPMSPSPSFHLFSFFRGAQLTSNYFFLSFWKLYIEIQIWVIFEIRTRLKPRTQISFYTVRYCTGSELHFHLHYLKYIHLKKKEKGRYNEAVNNVYLTFLSLSSASIETSHTPKRTTIKIWFIEAVMLIWKILNCFFFKIGEY